MKRTLFSIAFLLASLFTFASHVDGGQLYWTALGNNQYVLRLQLIRWADGAGLSATANINSNVPSRANINLTRIQIDSVTPECYAAVRQYEIHTYESNVITIPSPSTGTPWIFTYSLCCMPNVTALNIDAVNSRAFYLKSTMYLAGANMSSPYIELHTVFHKKNSRNMLIPAISKNGRPVELNLSPLLDPDGTPYMYKPGFSATKPTSPLDTLMPSGLFISGNTDTAGLAYLSFTAVERDMSGVIMTESNFTFGYSFRNPTPTVNDPDVTISSNSVQFNVIDTSLITIKSGMGHNIVLQLDANVNAGNSSPNTSIIARLYSDAISHRNIPDPTLINRSGSGLLDSGSISTEFLYTVPYGFPVGKTRFVVTFEDGNCPINGLSTRIIEIENSGQYYFEYAVCEGDSLQFTTPVQGQTFSWYPTTGVSSPSDSVTFIKPNNSNIYRLIVDGDTVARYQLHINKATKPIIRMNSFAQIELLNENDYSEDQLLWFYTEVDGEKNKTSYATRHEGLYHVRGGPRQCSMYSDSMQILLGSTRYLSLYDRYVEPDFTPDLSSSFHTFIFRVRFGTGYGPTDVQKIIIPKVTAGTGSNVIELEYTDESSGQTYIANGELLPDGHLEFVLPTSVVTFNRTYTFTLRAQSGSLTLSMGTHDGTPFSTRHAEVITTRFYNNTIGVRYDLLPQIIFAGTGDISVSENPMEKRVYPQPADDFIIVEGATQNTHFEIINASGSAVMSQLLPENGRISTHGLPSGIYILKLENAKEMNVQKIVVSH